MTFSRRALLAAAAGQTQLLPIEYRDYSRCLPDYLRALAAGAYAARNREIARLTTPAAIRARQAWARATFWKLTGGQPERTPLNARVTGHFERKGYRVEKVVYESRPGFHIPSLLYLPAAGRPPYPGVLFQMGHALNGKASETYQRCCQGLVQLGFVVLAFDPMGQGERVYYPDQSGTRSRFASADDEHTHPGRQMLLGGDTATRLQVWDAVRSLDYLATHPLVDPKRLASTGQSGGGTLTMLLMAADDRLAAAVVSSGNTENLACAAYNPPGSTDDAEQNFIDAGPLGFDRWDVMYPFAPRPLLVSVSAKDFVGTYSPQYIVNGREEFAKLRAVYRTLGREDRIAWAETPLPHGLAYDSRLNTYNWLRRWLLNQPEPLAEEPPTAPEPDDALRVSQEGNVVRAWKGETPATLLRASLRREGPAPLDRLLRFEPPPAIAAPVVLRRVPSRGLSIEAIEVRSASGVMLPAWLFIPANRNPGGPVLLAIDQSGRNGRWRESDVWQTLARSGTVVCAADVRGTGDLLPEYGRGNPRYTGPHAGEEDFAWASLSLGRPLVGQRTTDIAALARALRAHPAAKGSPLRLAANGRMTVPALCAAALDRAIDELYLSGGLSSFRSVVDADDYTTPLASFIPGILRHTDLPEIAASIAPRKIVLAGTVDAHGHALRAEAVRELYRSSNVEVRERGGWDEGALRGT
jgi:dienelactone hydrolase